jgi:hypothetical protein
VGSSAHPPTGIQPTPRGYAERTDRAHRAILPVIEDRPGPTVLLHRPARTHPELPPLQPIVLTAPPTSPPPDPQGIWAVLMPVLGSLTLVAFALFTRNLLFLLIAGIVVIAMIAGTLGMRARTRRQARRRHHDQVTAWQVHRTEVSHKAAQAASQQIDA